MIPKDELEWIGQFYGNGLDLKVSGIERITNFTFLWNIFETFACDTWADYSKISTAVDKMKPFADATLSPFVDYFSKRYFKNNVATHYFEGLKFRPNGGDVPAKEKITQVLTLKETDPVETLKALLYILYRYRNNLFHGGKQMNSIVGQIDNFVVANNLLIEVLQQMKAQGLVNFNS
jgi:hypothetical protein